MADAGVLLGLLAMAMGMAAITVLFFAPTPSPKFKRATELLSFAVLAILAGTGVLILNNLFTLGAVSEGVAAVTFFIGVALIIHITRTAE
ncbi:MAG: hypothetical protein HY366_03050 [Candidatus Aenigmarchaeota archaeon]|nr:hypothetical protein [Candidatus Aenigmarchaeota archaeon]